MKKILITLLTLMIIIVFTGCGSDNQEKSSSTSSMVSSSTSSKVSSSDTEQTINTNLPIPEQIDEHIKKVVDKNDYINVEVNEHMGRNDGTKMVLVYVKAHGYKTYKSALINATKVFKELYTSQVPIG